MGMALDRLAAALRTQAQECGRLLDDGAARELASALVHLVELDAITAPPGDGEARRAAGGGGRGRGDRPAHLVAVPGPSTVSTAASPKGLARGGGNGGRALPGGPIVSNRGPSVYKNSPKKTSK